MRPGSVITLRVTVSGEARLAERAPVEVPDVVGLTRAQASDRLTNAGLEASWEPVQTEGQAPGVIVTQTPQPGARVNRRSAITLYVAVSADAMPAERAPVEVPDVVGLTRSEGSDRLTKAGLEASWEPVQAQGRPPGVIVTQTPQPGARVNRGSAITLYVTAYRQR